MRTILRGCTFDDETREWAIWMNKPNSLTIPDRELYNKLLGNDKCYLKNVTNKKGIPMLVIKGKLPPMVRDLNSFLIQMRADFTKYVNSKKEKQTLPNKGPLPQMKPYWVK